MALAGEFLPGLGRSDEREPPAPAPPEKRGRGRPPGSGKHAQRGPDGKFAPAAAAAAASGTQKKEAPAPGALREHSAAKQEAKKGLPWFRENEILSEQEAKALYEPLKAALGDYFDYIDEYVWYREQHTMNDAPIWSNYDDDELSAIARLMIKRGKRSAAAAAVVRGMVNGDDYITTAIFAVPRIVETQRRLRAAPKRERRGRRA